MKTLSSWNRMNERSEEAREKANQRRRDIRVEKSAGIWDDPRDKYLNSNGKPKADVPVWFKNIYQTWNKGGEANTDTWNVWCNQRMDNAGYDPRIQKKKVGRPKLPDNMRKQPKRTGRALEMEQLLLDQGIHLTRTTKYGTVYLTEHPTVQFLPNGRLEIEDKTRISVFKFLSNLATV